MSSMLRRLLAVFFTLWLPLSAVAAAMMPVCAHENAKQMHTAHAAEQGCEQHHACPDQAAGDTDAATGDCAQCGLCLFACTPWLPGAQSPIYAVSTFAVIDGIFPALHSLAVPPADRPPLSAA